MDLKEQQIINDNRNYDYSFGYSEIRDEYPLISSLIIPGSKVIDLGCGDGSLLQLLKKEKQIDETGLEISDSGLELCQKKNVNAIKHRIDSILPFKDNQFDYSICNVTIQMVMYPEILLTEMKRISHKIIISFPNFSFYKNRVDLYLYGRMPKPMIFGYHWYDTGHIHQLSIIDFFELVDNVGGLKVAVNLFSPSKAGWKNILMKSLPNLFQHIPVFLLEKSDV